MYHGKLSDSNVISLKEELAQELFRGSWIQRSFTLPNLICNILDFF